MCQPDEGPSVVQAPRRCRGFITELVVRCGRGDEPALGRLLDLFYAPLLASTARQGRPTLSEDLVSEAFVRLWRAAPSFTPGQRCVVDWVMDHLDEPAQRVAPVLAAS